MNETWWICYTDNLLWSVEWGYEKDEPVAAHYQVDMFGDPHEIGSYMYLPHNWEYMHTNNQGRLAESGLSH